MPSKPGVYLYLDKSKNVIYVGKAKDLKARVSSYFTSPTQLGPKTQALVEQIHKIKIIVVESEIESLLLEAFYIKQYRPRYNIRLTDDKSYPLIKITVKDAYPTVLFTRRMDDKKAVYFGPFPSSGSVKLVLKTLRRAFPYQAVTHHPKRICLYHHLGLCPCPPMFSSPALKREYRKNIRNIVRVLEGKSQVVMQELIKEMEKKSKDEKFEEAQEIKRKIKALEIITQPTRQPFEYDINPNLRTDLRKSELDGLLSALQASGLVLSDLERIECYDISNIQGTNATGSMVVLTQGEIDKSQYRKFKIRRDWEKSILDSQRIQADSHARPQSTPNDFAMMQEMLERRLKHQEWKQPSLLVIDGGKGQLSSVLEAMKIKKIHYPIVGLAKREETIVIPTNQQFFDESKVSSEALRLSKHLYGKNEDNFREVSLAKDSPSLHVVQRIRNEAHRFAITYHRKLRSKATLA